MSETRRFRFALWAVIFFVLATAVPGWYVQMRLLEKVSRMERRISALESQLATALKSTDPPPHRQP